MFALPFRDRTQAGKLLGEASSAHSPPTHKLTGNSIILGAGGGVRLLDERLIQKTGILRDEMERSFAREAQEVLSCEALYRVGQPAWDLGGRAVLLADDGFVTGK